VFSSFTFNLLQICTTIYYLDWLKQKVMNLKRCFRTLKDKKANEDSL